MDYRLLRFAWALEVAAMLPALAWAGPVPVPPLPPPVPPAGFFRMKGFALRGPAVQRLGLDLALPSKDGAPPRGTLMMGSWRYSLQEVRVAKEQVEGAPIPQITRVRAVLYGLPALPTSPEAPTEAKPAAKRPLSRVGDLDVQVLERRYGIAEVQVVKGRIRFGRRRWDVVGSPGRPFPRPPAPPRGGRP